MNDLPNSAFFTRKKKLFLESVRKWPGERRLSPLWMASCFWQLSLLTLCSLQCALLASLSHSLNNNSRVQLILFQFYICEHSNVLYVWFFFSCAPHLTDLLKLRVAGESGQDGKEDTTVIQEMITTLQVISFFLDALASLRAMIKIYWFINSRFWDCFD